MPFLVKVKYVGLATPAVAVAGDDVPIHNLLTEINKVNHGHLAVNGIEIDIICPNFNERLVYGKDEVVVIAKAGNL